MTSSQARILAYVTERLRTTGIAPTYREMAQALGFAGWATIQRQIGLLVEDGHLVRLPGRARAISLPPATICPHCGADIHAPVSRR